MDKNSNKDFASKEQLKNLLNGFANKNIEISGINTEKILNLINGLSEEDIKKISQLAQNGEFKKSITNMANNEKTKR